MESATKKATKSKSLITGTKSGKVCHRYSMVIKHNDVTVVVFSGKADSWGYFQDAIASLGGYVGHYHSMV